MDQRDLRNLEDARRKRRSDAIAADVSPTKRQQTFSMPQHLKISTSVTDSFPNESLFTQRFGARGHMLGTSTGHLSSLTTPNFNLNSAGGQSHDSVSSPSADMVNIRQDSPINTKLNDTRCTMNIRLKRRTPLPVLGSVDNPTDSTPGEPVESLWLHEGLTASSAGGKWFPPSSHYSKRSSHLASSISSSSLLANNSQQSTESHLSPYQPSPQAANNHLGQAVISRIKVAAILKFLQVAAMTARRITPNMLEGLRDVGNEDFSSAFIEVLHRIFRTPEQYDLLRPLVSEQNWYKFYTFNSISSEDGQETISENRIMEAIPFHMDRDVYEGRSIFPLDPEAAREKVRAQIALQRQGYTSNPRSNGPPFWAASSVPNLVTDRYASDKDWKVWGFGSKYLTCQNHNMRNYPVSRPGFQKFMQLPPELRKRIYEAALSTGQAIKPHLCDDKHNGEIKFHDDTQNYNHTAISDLLGITRVSKQVRAESLPCFYSGNTFTVGHDTAIYFVRLEHLGHFHMIRHVRFDINMRKEKYALETLLQMNKHIQDMEIYERDTVAPVMTMPGFIRYTQTHAMLKNHPAYVGGGLQFLAEFTCLRMLTSSFTDNEYTIGAGEGYTTKLVLPIPSTLIFQHYPTLQWFPAVCHGLGIHLHYLEGHEVSYSKPRSIGITWHQQFQKKDFAEKYDGGKRVDIKARAIQLFSELEEDSEYMEYIGGSMLYYRMSCDGQELTWYKVKH